MDRVAPEVRRSTHYEYAMLAPARYFVPAGLTHDGAAYIELVGVVGRVTLASGYLGEREFSPAECEANVASGHWREVNRHEALAALEQADESGAAAPGVGAGGLTAAVLVALVGVVLLGAVGIVVALV